MNSVYEAVGDRFLVAIANHAIIDSKLALVKYQKGGYVVAFKVLKEDLVKVKTKLLEVLRTFAVEENVQYLTQAFSIGISEYLVVKVLSEDEGGSQ